MPVPIFLPPQFGKAPLQQRSRDGVLKITFREQTVTLDPQVAKYEKGVTATFGETTIRCDELEIHYDVGESYGIASGHVRLDDPVGRATADEITFSWVAKTGTARNVVLKGDNLQVTAEGLHIEPNHWTLHQTEAEGYAGKTILLSMKAKQGVIVPGKRVRLIGTYYGVLGKPTVKFPDYTSNLDRSAFGLKLPGLSYRQGSGLGVNWESRFRLGAHTTLLGGYTTYPRSLPSFSGYVTYGFGPTDGKSRIDPISEFGDRFENSYFLNAGIVSPKSDRDYIGRTRNSLSLGTAKNVTLSGRDESVGYTKGYDLVYERSNAIKETSLLGQVRFQSVSRLGSPSEQRAVVWAAAAPPTIRAARGLDLYSRLDYSTFTESGFQWGRVLVGSSFQPTPLGRVSFAGYTGFQSGNPTFPGDRLDSTRGWMARTDLLSGPTKVSYLWRFNAGNKLIDREYAVTQAIGFLEGFVTFRRITGDYRWGVRVRMDGILDALQDINPKRPKGAR